MSSRTSPMDGAWLDEPDWDKFVHAGYECQITRNQMGGLCGYLALPLSHPYAGKSSGIDVTVHGGWNYFEDHFPCKRSKAHWVMGFHCSHSDDLAPYLPPHVQALLEMMADARGKKLVYRTMEYVRAELVRACDELALVAIPSKETNA